MLSYTLAIAVALSSLVLFSTAFVMSDIHRQDDFLWSGIGLFYALVLWFCARNITGAVLLGQAAAASLLVSYNWQTLKLRKVIAHPNKVSTTNNFSVLQTVNSFLKRNKSQPQVTTDSNINTTSDKVTDKNIAIPDQTSKQTKSQESNNQPSSSQTVKPKGLGKLFGNKKQPSLTNTKLDEILDEKTIAQTTTNSVDKTIEDQKKADSQKIVVEVADNKPKEVENKQAEPKILESNWQSQEEVPTITIETSPTIPQDDRLKKAENVNFSNINEQLGFETVDPEITVQTPVTQPEKKSSSLDSLETVEVAEVLDASPEERFGDRESEQIIEVTTTEIKLTIEEKTDHNQAQDSDSESSQQS